jgi:hypothetical protein
MNQILEKTILEKSQSKDLKEALDEWTVDISEETDQKTHCICGHLIKNVYTATNLINDNKITPIGSVCIKSFSDYKDSLIYKSYVVSLQMYCEDCDMYLCNKQAYKLHIHSEKHEKNIGSRKCLDCTARITADNPEWKTRCLKCYKKNSRKAS